MYFIVFIGENKLTYLTYRGMGNANGKWERGVGMKILF